MSIYRFNFRLVRLTKFAWAIFLLIKFINLIYNDLLLFQNSRVIPFSFCWWRGHFIPDIKIPELKIKDTSLINQGNWANATAIVRAKRAVATRWYISCMSLIFAANISLMFCSPSFKDRQCTLAVCRDTNKISNLGHIQPAALFQDFTRFPRQRNWFQNFQEISWILFSFPFRK